MRRQRRAQVNRQTLYNKVMPNEPKQPRKARGPHIEETALMKALEDDPAAAMQALADEAESDWDNLSPKANRGMLSSEVGE